MSCGKCFGVREWANDWVTYWVTEYLTDWLSAYLPEWLTEWLSDRLTDIHIIKGTTMSTHNVTISNNWLTKLREITHNTENDKIFNQQKTYKTLHLHTMIQTYTLFIELANKSYKDSTIHPIIQARKNRLLFFTSNRMIKILNKKEIYELLLQYFPGTFCE